MKDTPSPLIHYQGTSVTTALCWQHPCLLAGGHLSLAQAVLTTAGWTEPVISTKDSSLALEPACPLRALMGGRGYFHPAANPHLEVHLTLGPGVPTLPCRKERNFYTNKPVSSQQEKSTQGFHSFIPAHKPLFSHFGDFPLFWTWELGCPGEPV